MVCLPIIKCSCTKCETLLVSFLYTTLPKLKPKTHPHVAEYFFRIRVTQKVKKCTSFHTRRGFIIFFTTVRHRTTLRLIEPQLTIRIWFSVYELVSSLPIFRPVLNVFLLCATWFTHLSLLYLNIPIISDAE